MRRARLALALILAPALAVAAGADARTAPAAQRQPTQQGPDLFGGYSYTHAGEANLNGWQLTATFPFRGVIRWEAGGALGAGIDGPVSRRWAVRVQADVLLLHGLGQWDTDPRLSAGAVYRFGR